MMGYFLICAGFLGGIIKKNSKTVTFFILIILWLIFAFNTDNSDFVGYENQYYYNNIIYEGSGQTPGFQFLIAISKAMGLDFMQFRGLVGLLCLVLIYCFAARYTDCVALVIALYAFLPFLYDVVQYRFYLAGCISLYSIRFLIECTGAKRLLFLVGVLLAATIHPAALLFLALFLAVLKEKWLKLISIMLFLAILIASYSGIAQSFASLFVDEVKYEAYFVSMSRFGFITYWVSCLGFFMLLFLSRGGWMPSVCALKETIDTDIADGTSLERRKLFLNFATKLAFAILPLVALIPLSTTNFFRPIRSLLVIAYILISIVAFERNRVLSRRERVLYVMLFIGWFVFTIWLIFSGVWDIVVATELTNNLLWP